MHQVLLTSQAQAELDAAYQWWSANRSSPQAERWYVGFVKKMLDLAQQPERGPLAPENELFPYQVRQLNYGLSGKPTHRAVYTIRRDEVVILRIRHLAQKPLTDHDL